MAQLRAQTWDLPASEPIDTNKTVNWKDAARFTDERVGAIGRINEIIKSEEQAFVNQERSGLESSLNFFQNFAGVYFSFLRNEEEAIKQFQTDIARHRAEHESGSSNLNRAQGEKAQIEQQILTADNEVKNLALKRKEIVAGINPTELSAIKFKDHLDPSNDVFKWVIEAVYGDSKTNYYWDNFKKNAFKKDKGEDFMARLRGLVVNKMKKEDFTFADSVYQRKDDILADLETKKKQNQSLRNLLEYIANIVQVGKVIDEIEADKAILAKKQSEIDVDESVVARSSLYGRSLEEKLKVSTFYVDTLKKQAGLFDSLNYSIKNRIQVQEQYLQSLQGDHQALNSLAQTSSKPRPQTQTSEPVYERQQYTQEIVQEQQTQGEHPVQKRPNEPEAESPDWKESPVKEHKVVTQEEEKAFFGSETKVQSHQQRKVENAAHLTDIGESELAKNEKGSCQNCTIF